MLEQAASMFENMEAMLKKVKKKTYSERMDNFRGKYGYLFTEMTDYVDNQEEKDVAVACVADTFVGRIQEHFQVKGKIGGRKQADMNFFMIYYVFPALLLTEHENATELADAICAKWGTTFKDSKIGYTTYDKLYDSFRNKIFGIF